MKVPAEIGSVAFWGDVSCEIRLGLIWIQQTSNDDVVGLCWVYFFLADSDSRAFLFLWSLDSCGKSR